MKLEILDPSVFKPEMFHNKRSYEAALYAVAICNNIIKKSKAGYLVLHYEQVVTPAFRIDDDGLFIQDSENCRTQFIGDVRHGESGKTWSTKKDVREFFKLWRICKITNVTKAYDLTK